MEMQVLQNFLSDMNSCDVAFILGAGASMNSGICKGSVFAYKWLEHLINMAGIPLDKRFCELKKKIDDGLLRELNRDNLSKLFDLEDVYDLVCSDFDSRCTWKMILKILLTGVEQNYFRIASYLVRQQPELLQDSILEAMQGKIASSGYFELAKIMQNSSKYSRKNIVITTNFDDLLLQAIYKNFSVGHRTPVVISHRSLAHQIKLMDITLNPIIFKVHHDFLFEPLNTEYDVLNYSEDVKKALEKLIFNRVLLVLGYSGAKDNLMEYLIHYDKRLTIYWGYYDNPPTTEKYNELLDSHHNVITFKAGDFDGFMEKLSLLLQLDSMGQNNGKRTSEIFNSNTSQNIGSPILNTENPIKKKTARDQLGLERF